MRKYVIRNLNKLDRIPNELREGIFERLFAVAEIAKFTKEEAEAYEDSLKSYRDLKNSLDTAFEEGMEKGMEKGIEKVTLELIKNKVPDEIVINSTGLTKEQLANFKEKIKKEE
ncbi:MAG: PD-(D/E)XK nuclease family transposase [Flammeovirgaceae bacterium]